MKEYKKVISRYNFISNNNGTLVNKTGKGALDIVEPTTDYPVLDPYLTAPPHTNIYVWLG